MRALHGTAALTLSLSLGCMSAQRVGGEAPTAELDDLAMEAPAEGKKSKPTTRRGRADKSAGAPPPPPPAGAPVMEEAEAEPAPDDAEEVATGDDGGDSTRSWFPESFLWRPHVETDASGRAEISMRVPDQLTTWRILALGHTRDGRTAGAVHTFDSTLPLYVEPAVPAWLHAGDQFWLPVQAVGLSGRDVPATLEVVASPPLVGSGIAEVVVPGSGAHVEFLSLEAVGAGDARVRASLVSESATDAAERVVPVIPRGRPVSTERGGTLSGERNLVMVGPDGAEPTTQQLQVRVFPGPLAILQAEVDRASSGAVQPGYGFVLASRLVELAGRTGTEVDAAAVRRLQIVGWQRIVQAARAPTPGVAADLLAAVRGVEGHALAERLQPRLVAAVTQGQRGDGTWARRERAPLQEVLAQTAWAARTLPASSTTARLRAAGALERYATEVDDAYTAALVLATGLLDEGQAAPLRDRVKGALTQAPDGSTTVTVPGSAVTPWGYRPTRPEMLAWTWLALHESLEPSVAGDLIAGLMQHYDARSGFGAGVADSVALEVVLRGLPVLDQPVEVILALDGEEVARAAVDPAQPKVPALLEALPGGRNPRITLATEPPVPGLAFVAQLASWLPWTGDERIPGVDVELSVEELRVGRPGSVLLTLAAPSRAVLEVEVGLPAGVVVDTDGLPVQSAEAGTDRLSLTTRTFGAGEVLEVPLTVTPSFAGSFGTRPLVVRVDGVEHMLPAPEWRVTR